MLPTSRERSKVNQAVAKTGKMRDTVQRSRQQAYHKALGRLGPPALICALHYCFSSSTTLSLTLVPPRRGHLDATELSSNGSSGLREPSC